jgi:hypothetical protein
MLELFQNYPPDTFHGKHGGYYTAYPECALHGSDESLVRVKILVEFNALTELILGDELSAPVGGPNGRPQYRLSSPASWYNR